MLDLINRPDQIARRTRISPLIVAAALMLVAPNPSAYALDLLEAYGYAQQNDAAFESARQQYEAAKLDLPLAKSANKPSITTDADLTHIDDELRPDEGDAAIARYEQGKLAFSLNQNLYDRSTRYDIESADTSVQIATLQLGVAREDLITRTVAAYLDVLAALDNRRLAELQLAAIGEQLDLATQRLDVGLGTKTDQYDAQARFETANADLIGAKNEVINAQQALEALMSHSFQMKPKQEMQVLDNEKVSFDLIQGDDWVESVLPNNRNYRISLRQIDRQQIEVNRAKDARWPTFGLFAGANAANTSDGALLGASDRQTWNAGVRGSMPIYLGGSIKLKQQKAGYSLNATQADSEQVRRDSDRLIRAARRGVETLNRQVEARKQAVIAGKSALKSKEEGFKAGVTTNIDVLNAQRDLFLAGRDYLLASYDLVNAIVLLERAIGELDDDDVVRINGWLK